MQRSAGPVDPSTYVREIVTHRERGLLRGHRAHVGNASASARKRGESLAVPIGTYSCEACMVAGRESVEPRPVPSPASVPRYIVVNHVRCLVLPSNPPSPAVDASWTLASLPPTGAGYVVPQDGDSAGVRRATEGGGRFPRRSHGHVDGAAAADGVHLPRGNAGSPRGRVSRARRR